MSEETQIRRHLKPEKFNKIIFKAKKSTSVTSYPIAPKKMYKFVDPELFISYKQKK